MKDKKKKLTTNAGAPVPGNQNVIFVGGRCPHRPQEVIIPPKVEPPK